MYLIEYLEKSHNLKDSLQKQHHLLPMRVSKNHNQVLYTPKHEKRIRLLLNAISTRIFDSVRFAFVGMLITMKEGDKTIVVESYVQLAFTTCRHCIVLAIESTVSRLN